MNKPRTNVAIAGAIAAKARRANADAYVATILPAIIKARTAGAITYQEVADALNACGILTGRSGQWNRGHVKRVEERARQKGATPEGVAQV